MGGKHHHYFPSILVSWFTTCFGLWSRKVMSIGLWQWLILAEACSSRPPTVIWQAESRPSKWQQEAPAHTNYKLAKLCGCQIEIYIGFLLPSKHDSSMRAATTRDAIMIDLPITVVFPSIIRSFFHRAVHTGDWTGVYKAKEKVKKNFGTFSCLWRNVSLHLVSFSPPRGKA